MPLLCISVLVLLLLPWSLSCDSKSSPETVTDHYRAIVRTDLQNTETNVTASLRSSTCAGQRKHRKLDCTAESSPEKIRILTILLKQACRMHKLRLPHVKKLASSVQDSINCPCGQKNRMTAGKQRHKRQNRHTNGPKKLCIAKAILSSMTVCYEMLNAL
uniref:Interleukin-7 n=1 Tax=Kryptolebias marmoratus TaxID=37003 RepID=A0A3Q3F0M8_KRYMA